MSDNWEPDDLDLEEEPEAPHLSLRERRMKARADARGNWYLVTGLLIGLAIGLLFSWVISPVKYLDTDPASLAPSYKDTYRRAVAFSYSVDHNLSRARAREKLIDGDRAIQALAAQAQRLLGENQLPEDARALAVLAADLSKSGDAVEDTPLPPANAKDNSTAAPGAPVAAATVDIAAAVQTPTVRPPTPTSTPPPRATFTPRPTATPVRFLSPFILKDKTEACSDTTAPGLLEVQVNDVDGKPLGGVRISILWQDGEDHFYTGLIPEKNLGYANFMMKPGNTYSLQVGDASKPINGLSVPACGGGWSLVFQEGNSTN